MRKINISFVVLLAIALFIASCGNMATKSGTSVAAIDLKNMDTTANPGDDFYQYVNGGWLKANPIPSTKSRFGAFDVIDEENRAQIKQLVEEGAKEANLPKGSNKQKMADFYASGMDSAQIEKESLTGLKAEFDKIANIKTVADIAKVSGGLYAIGVAPFVYIWGDQDAKNSKNVIAQIYQGGLSLSDRDLYLENDVRSKEIRAGFLKHVSEIFVLLGEKAEKADANAKRILEMETEIAKFSMSRMELRNPLKTYNKMTVEQLVKFTPNFDWKQHFEAMGFAYTGDCNLAQTGFAKGLDKMLKTVSVDDWKIFLNWKLVHSFAPVLSDKFVSSDFDFYGKIVRGKEQNEPRWKRVLDNVSNGLGEAIGQLYVEKYFPPQAKAKMLDLVKNLRIAFAERINQLDWMTAETKTKAIEKLNAIDVKIGYPDKWRDYSKLEIDRKSYIINIIKANRFELEYSFSKIGKPVDRTEWGMTPQTVNAYYNPSKNEIVFPAGILQPPFFNMNADDAVNYGGIGVVIGHEMTHGFDDEGRMFDKEGNLVKWWTDKDSVEFNKRTKLLVDHYNGFNPIDTMHISGSLTLGENIADYGGLTISYLAYQIAQKANPTKEKIDGFTPEQRFFIAYAQVWRQNIRDKELMRRIKEDVHSPGKYRVNGGVFNIPQFYAAFNIKPENKLYRTPEQRPVIW
jgi:putative endopeptidase